jgi:hypothetical protein
MTIAGADTLGRRDIAMVGLIWATLAAAFIFVQRGAIDSMWLPDADDYLRLQQVRDWLAGQSWFDITQHRINPPAGGAMHWSRIVDIPLAAGITLLTPLIGREAAEMAVATSTPLLLMGAAMLLVAAITTRLVGRLWAPVAAVCVPLSPVAYAQVAPLRVDHHAWQLVSALTLLWAMLDETHKRRSGAVAGVAAALWLNISIEGLPLVTCAALLLGVRWLFDARELPRLQAYLWALTLGSFMLETLTMPTAWSVAECDRISLPYLSAFAAASLAATAAGWPRLAQGPRIRLAFAGAAGLAAAMAFAAVGPQCLGGPFEDLDPLTRQFWLDRIGESMPLIKVGAGAFIAYAGFAACGCVGAAMAVRATCGEARLRWITALILMLAASLFMLAVSRTGAVAHGFAAVGAAFLGMVLLNRARAANIMVVRVLGTVLALTAATPVLLRPAMHLDFKPGVNRRVCASAEASLNALPASLLLAPIDIGPRIIAGTPHSVIATGHHRNYAAMRQVIATFTGPSSAARDQVTAGSARYVVLCAEAPEVRNYARRAPDGFAARLIAGDTPDWLRRLDIGPAGSGLLVFAVEPNPSRERDSLRGRLAFDLPPPARS